MNREIKGLIKRLFNWYYFTCTCTDKKIRVHSERDLWKFRFCPFCGMKIKWEKKDEIK